ncbi:uncharacterized protein LOC134650290 [Cydia amplana]|uniref:uncharacterized protein LOC134650290 n=1 Tax=Cydia amplana TaxID=1869771 RepID=UPI002FE60623
MNHQFPVYSNSEENMYPPTPILYTSIVSNPVTEYGNIKLTENSAEPTLHLEPKRIPYKAKNISPSTYRPHINHDVKMLHSHHSHLRPKVYKALATTAATPTFEMADLHHLAIFHQLHQQLDQEPKYIAPTTTIENPKLSHILNLGVKILPKQGVPFITMPHELSRNTPFQPIPRIAYHKKFNVV